MEGQEKTTTDIDDFVAKGVPLKAVNLVNNLVEQVRSHFYVNIQSLHGTMPLWGIDHWVPLGDLFVDVNILELLSSNRRSELDDLWQDFTTSNSDYRSLERIGLGKRQQRVSGLAVLKRNTNLMVVGKPGSGKTTYLQRIVTECNDGKLQAQRIPVLIKLREFVDDGRKYAYNLEQFLEQLWLLSNADIKLVLNLGRALVLLDGLDEVVGEAGKQITKEIKRFARTYPLVQVVVTCRTQSQESRFERFNYVEVADFNEKQVKTFVAHWFGTVCGNVEDKQASVVQSQEFLKQLFREENKPIRELAITPILLSLTCAVFQQTGKFYSKRSKLYKEGLEILLEKWDNLREVERDEIYRDLSSERKLKLLSYVAVKKFEQQQYVLFEQEELEEYIGVFLEIKRQDSPGVLQAIESQHGLLIERAYKVWSFSHLTFSEYFVAWYIVNYRDFDKLVSQITKKYWYEVFPLTVEMLENATDLLILMKQKIDYLIFQNGHLQDFITVIYEQSITRDSSGNPAAIRAFNGIFYSNPNLESILDNVESQTALLEAIELYTQKEIEADIQNGNFSIIYPYPYDFVNIPGDTRESDKWMDELLFDNRASDNPASLESRSIYISEVMNLIDSIENIVNTAVDLASIIDKTFQAELEQIIEEVKEIINDTESNSQDVAELESLWYQVQPKVSELRDIVVRKRDEDWIFTQEEHKLLQVYYEANKLLMICLNGKCLTGDKLRKEIEETLLLPIIEIERRRC